MKIPKIFVPEKIKEIDSNKTEIPIMTLEDLILGSINSISCDEKTITTRVSSYSSWFEEAGIKIRFVERVAVSNYGVDSITLIEYKTEQDLDENMKELCKKGKENFDKYRTKFKEIFLFKNNVTIYLNGDEDFNKEAANRYKRLGFKHTSKK